MVQKKTFSEQLQRCLSYNSVLVRGLSAPLLNILVERYLGKYSAHIGKIYILFNTPALV